MGKRVVDEASLVSVADSIRAKCGTSDALTFPSGFAAAIAAIAAGDASGIGVESGVYIPSEDVRWITFDVSDAAHDGCLVASLVCTNTPDEITALIGDKQAGAAVVMFRDEYMYIGAHNNRDCYVSVGRAITDGVLGSYPTTGTGLTNYASGISTVDNTIYIAGSNATFYFRAGLTYQWNVYYTKEASA